MRGRLVLGVLSALLAAAPLAQAAPPVTLGKGPGGLLALDAAEGLATAVIGNSSVTRPFAALSSDGFDVGSASTFGAVQGRDPDIVASPSGAEVAWARVVNGGLEYSTAVVTDGEVGDAAVVGKGTGPPQMTLVDGSPVIARTDVLGNTTLGEGAGLTSDAPGIRHLPLDVTLYDRAPIVLDLAQAAATTTIRVLGTGAPSTPVVELASREDLDGSLVVDEGIVYVGYLRNARAYLATAKLAPDARWTVRRLPGPGGGSGVPAVARTEGITYVAYAQGSYRRNVYLARIEGGRLRLKHLTRHPRDDSRPMIAASGDGGVFVGWTRQRRGAQTGTALLMKTD